MMSEEKDENINPLKHSDKDQYINGFAELMEWFHSIPAGELTKMVFNWASQDHINFCREYKPRPTSTSYNHTLQHVIITPPQSGPTTAPTTSNNPSTPATTPSTPAPQPTPAAQPAAIPYQKTLDKIHVKGQMFKAGDRIQIITKRQNLAGIWRIHVINLQTIVIHRLRQSHKHQGKEYAMFISEFKKLGVVKL